MSARDFVAMCVCASLGCAGEASLPPIHTLHPDPNPMPHSDPLWSPQPHRDRPRAACATSDGTKAWVMLAGIEDDPGSDVAIIDLDKGVVTKRVALAPSPWGCALDPTERYLVVTLRYSDRAIVLDARTDTEIARIQVPYYTEVARFSLDGRRLWLTNRWKDAVLHWDLDLSDGFAVSRTSYDDTPIEDPMGIPVSENPTSLALSPDGTRLFVGSVAGLTTAVIDTQSATLIDVDGDPKTTTPGAPAGITHIDFHSPVGGLATSGDLLFLTDTGTGTGSHPTQGLDLDDDGKPGDNTANVVFQDLQNEIAVVDARTFQPLWRYTSDSICCADFRDVDPDRPDRGLLLPAPDTWKPDVVPFLPPKDRWIVAGSLPLGMVVKDGVLFVIFAGTSDVQSFQIQPDGSLAPLQKAGGLYTTGFNPVAILRAGARILTVDRLGESLTLIDPKLGPGHETHIPVGDLTAGPFPATDVEIGEAVNEMTARFTIDGDQTCVHCHRDNAAIARPIVMPLQKNRLWGARNVMAQRGLYDTRPWFAESSMDETNFFPVLNEFARKENFCCEGIDPTVWSKYPGGTQCAADPTQPGCSHVVNCLQDPPPECGARPYAKTTFLVRGEFFKEAARQTFGRDRTFGDALYNETIEGGREPIWLDFDGITRAIGLFMLRTPRLLPNPNRSLGLPTARRGETLFQQPGTGCQSCHPLPLTTTATLPVPFSPFGMPVRVPPVISPAKGPDGSDASQVTKGFLASFPQTIQGDAGIHFGATPLRGLWDRPQTRFFHHGQARTLVQALATPGHAALGPGERGFNERNGTFDTHGGTSQLDRYQLQDLINFLLTL